MDVRLSLVELLLRFLGLMMFHFQSLQIISSPSGRIWNSLYNPSNTIIILFFNEYIMVNCIKSFFQINKNPCNIFIIIWVWTFSIIDMSALFVENSIGNQTVDCRSKLLVLGTCSAFCALVFVLFYWHLIRGRLVYSCYNSLNSFLKIGTTLAVLKVDGKTPWAKDLFINSESRMDIVFLICFMIFCGKLFESVLLLVLNLE